MYWLALVVFFTVSAPSAVGQTVVERAALANIFAEQRIRLTYASENDNDTLQIGKLIGADQIVFANHTVRLQSDSR